MPVGEFRRGEGDGKRPILVVVLHGWMSSPRHMKDVISASCEELGGANRVDILAPRLQHAHWYSSARAVDAVLRVLFAIDKAVQAEQGYERIVLVGHSIGATIARRVFLVASGNPPGFLTEKEFADQQPRAWAHKVDRIILLAAFNRGWQISERLSWWYSFWLNFYGILGHLAPKRWAPTIFDIRLGAPFMVQTRLHWLAFRRGKLVSGPSNDRSPAPRLDTALRPILIQLLGSKDDLISPFDQVDIAVDSDTTRAQTYFLIQLAQTDHRNIIDFGRGGRFPDAGKQRELAFKGALARPSTELAGVATSPALLVDQFEKPDSTVRHTVFVIHGIRDDGFWTHRIAERVRQQWPSSKEFRAWTPSYGYFAMLPFILPWIRRQKVEWFMDQYVSAVAQYPNSVFHYVGHSNGTYLATRALFSYPACAFRQVFFAGSVVRRDYDWETPISQGRVAQILNVVASCDWVVALLPKSLEWFRAFDLGGAGFDGFKGAGKGLQSGNVIERRYVKGSHSAGIDETQWQSIAEFIANGKVFVADAKDGFVRNQSAWLRAVSNTHCFLWVVAAFFGLFAPALIVSRALDLKLHDLVLRLVAGSAAHMPAMVASPEDGVVRATTLFVYILVVKFVVTRL